MVVNKLWFIVSLAIYLGGAIFMNRVLNITSPIVFLLFGVVIGTLSALTQFKIGDKQ